jgi:hypothetical protein
MLLGQTNVACGYEKEPHGTVTNSNLIFNPRYPLLYPRGMRFCGAQSESVHCLSRKKSCPAGDRTQYLHPTCALVSVLIESLWAPCTTGTRVLVPFNAHAECRSVISASGLWDEVWVTAKESAALPQAPSYRISNPRTIVIPRRRGCRYDPLFKASAVSDEGAFLYLVAVFGDAMFPFALLLRSDRPFSSPERIHNNCHLGYIIRLPLVTCYMYRCSGIESAWFSCRRWIRVPPKHSSTFTRILSVMLLCVVTCVRSPQFICIPFVFTRFHKKGECTISKPSHT